MKTANIRCKIDQRSIEKYVKEQRSLGGRITLSDQVCGGLKLVINNRSCSWTYAYRKRGYADGGKRHPQRTMKLGDPASMSPAEARVAAETVKAQVRAGEDPAILQRTEARLRLAQEARRRTCTEWLDKYNADRLDAGRSKHQRDEFRNVRLALSELSLSQAYPEEITPRHLRSLSSMHQDRPATCHQRLGATARFLDYLLDEEVLSSNPYLSLSRRSRPKPPPPRMNFFSPEQLKTLWYAEGLKDSYQRYLRFMITTPLRAGEVAGLIWHQIDSERAEITLEASDTKNSEHFVMPLGTMALSVIGRDKADSEQLVFPLSSHVGKPMTSWSHFNRCVRNASGIQSFMLHDLRRTFSTLMAENSEFAEGIIDGLLNHRQSATRGGVIRHYQKAKHLEKRREVIAHWHRLLDLWL